MEETEEFDSLADVPLPNNVSRDDFLAVQERDDEIVICGEHDDEELIIMARSAKRTRLEDAESDNETSDCDEEEVEEALSSSTVFKALGVVRKYCQKTGLERPVFTSD